MLSNSHFLCGLFALPSSECYGFSLGIVWVALNYKCCRIYLFLSITDIYNNSLEWGTVCTDPERCHFIEAKRRRISTLSLRQPQWISAKVLLNYITQLLILERPNRKILQTQPQRQLRTPQ